MHYTGSATPLNALIGMEDPTFIINKDPPAAYITGKKTFYGLEFTISKDVMIPRKGSEVLVKAAIVESLHFKHEPIRILDLGTGSGCILLSILHYTCNSIGIGCDISEEALRISKKNSIKLGLEARSSFILLDFTKIHEESKGNEIFNTSFDIIVCNPPYLDVCNNPNIHEPLSALVIGGKGMNCYIKISESLEKRRNSLLKKGGVFIIEIRKKVGVADILEKLFYERNGFTIKKRMRDSFGFERALVFENKLI
ncbi:bifunctional methyltransferase-like [Zophobas morio]|uniref:bifunctional methyltransferase-like n=1 Tax=Zophobas morio TaxID=2755281 RepID=UPI003082B771